MTSSETLWPTLKIFLDALPYPLVNRYVSLV